MAVVTSALMRSAICTYTQCTAMYGMVQPRRRRRTIPPTTPTSRPPTPNPAATAGSTPSWSSTDRRGRRGRRRRGRRRRARRRRRLRGALDLDLEVERDLGLRRHAGGPGVDRVEREVGDARPVPRAEVARVLLGGDGRPGDVQRRVALDPEVAADVEVRRHAVATARRRVEVRRDVAQPELLEVLDRHVAVRGHVQPLAGFEPERVVEVLGGQQRVAVAARLEDRRGVERAAADDRLVVLGDRRRRAPATRGRRRARASRRRPPAEDERGGEPDQHARDRHADDHEPAGRARVVRRRVGASAPRWPRVGVGVGVASSPASRVEPDLLARRQELDAELERDRDVFEVAAVERDAEQVLPALGRPRRADALRLDPAELGRRRPAAQQALLVRDPRRRRWRAGRSAASSRRPTRTAGSPSPTPARAGPWAPRACTSADRRP